MFARYAFIQVRVDESGYVCMNVDGHLHVDREASCIS